MCKSKSRIIREARPRLSLFSISSRSWHRERWSNYGLRAAKCDCGSKTCSTSAARQKRTADATVPERAQTSTIVQVNQWKRPAPRWARRAQLRLRSPTHLSALLSIRGLHADFSPLTGRNMSPLSLDCPAFCDLPATIFNISHVFHKRQMGGQPVAKVCGVDHDALCENVAE